MKTGEMTGIFQGSGRGYGFFIPDDGGEDRFVPPRRDGGAWDGDTVRVRPVTEEQEGGRKLCAVTAVVERANRTVVGTLEKQGREYLLRPDNRRLPLIRVLVKKGRAAGGEKAAVAVLSYGGRNELPLGRLQETFGRAGSRQAAVDAALYRYDIETAFPPDVLTEAEKAPQTVAPQAIEGRRDLRAETIITIDGASAKDLDDAVSLTRDGAGRWVLGVHIADVSHYVRPGSALDREAFQRGTSVYFADRVIPMLPPELSNGICSLNPRVDRLTLSCVMTLDGKGEVVEYDIFKSVIRTAERMTYGDCNELLDGKNSDLEQKYGHIRPMLTDMAALAEKLARKRRLRGALELESREAVVLCDAQGAPVGMELREQGRSEKLIEEFMLCANETVAKHLKTLGKPAVYRIHEKPSADKVERLRAMLAPFGLDVKQADHFALQKVLEAVKDRPEGPAVNAMLLRSMMKARYDAENLGHFGLAAEYYCHFTSPIRRYPDLMVHRILTALLEGRLGGGEENRLTAQAQRAAAQSSERELAAQNAEREIEKFYMAEYMQSHIGDTFPGVISGVTRTGLFVTLPFGAEGLLGAEHLPGRDFEYDERRLRLTGRGGAAYSFGMALEVVCLSADPGTGHIELGLAGEAPPRRREERPAPARKPGKRRSSVAPKRRRR